MGSLPVAIALADAAPAAPRCAAAAIQPIGQEVGNGSAAPAQREGVCLPIAIDEPESPRQARLAGRPVAARPLIHEVLVLDEFGQAVADAEVWCAAGSEEAPLPDAVRSANFTATTAAFRCDFAAPRRSATRTNARGRAELRVDEAARMCYARAATAVGAMALIPGVTPRTAALEITLRRIRRVEIRTVANSGRSVGGVPLVLREVPRAGVDARRIPKTVYLGCTGPSGRLELQDLDRLTPACGQAAYEVAADMLQGGPGTMLDPAARVDSLRVVVPEFGELTVRVFGRCGGPVAGARVVLAGAADATAASIESRPYEWGRTNAAGIVV
ncbi:MAG: hypothetical protein KDC98_07420, partial [Planctomycetes bacterium]|nr:hypothetical protein [Planctomycetota bacterium]